MARSTTNRPCVLVAEDCPCVLELLKLYLEQAGYHVNTAESVAEALDMAQKTPIDLIVSDLRLKDGTAWQLMSGLSAIRPTPGIVISGYSDTIHRDLSKRAGFSEYLVKPIEQEQLVEAADRLLGARQQIRR
jgi:CheY-like chemotaxis protein